MIISFFLSLLSVFSMFLSRTLLSFFGGVSSKRTPLSCWIDPATDRVCFLVGPVSHIRRQSSTLVVSLGHLQPFVSQYIPSVLLPHGSSPYLSLPVECSFLRAHHLSPELIPLWVSVKLSLVLSRSKLPLKLYGKKKKT